MERELNNYFDLKFNTIDTENEHYFYIKVTGKLDLPVPQRKTILLLVDKSGSMEGENIKHTKQVIKKFLDFFRQNMNDASINLIIFDSKQMVIKEANKINKSSIDSTIDRIKADDCTNFSGVLDSMSNLIKTRQNIDDLSIIFLTDGKIEYTSDIKDDFKILKASFDQLKSSITKHVKKCDIHAIGLGKGHDPFFLEKIINIQPLNSSFQFIINETGIEPSFNAVKDMIHGNHIEGQLLISDQNNTDILDLTLIETEPENGKRVWECLSKSNINMSEVNKKESNITIGLSNGQVQERFYLKDVYDNNSNQENAFKIHLSKIRDEIKTIFELLKTMAEKNKFTIKELDEYSKSRTKLRMQYQNVAIKLYKVKDKDLKTSLYKICEDISPILNVIDELLTAGYKNQVKSEILGKAIQLSHKNIKKKKYIDELESRLPATVRLFNKQDTEINELAANVKSNDLYKIHSDLVEQYTCFLSCNDFIEAIKDGDCLCLTFALTRTEQAIMVPSTIQITAIYPTVISAQSFMNSIKYSINLNFDQNSENSEQVVIGEAREKINGCLPLFLSKEHWQISKILMDRILGWIVTLDPMGYHINQKMTFPYILLEYVIQQLHQNPDSEFIKTYYNSVLDICLNIMLEEEKEHSNFRNNLNKLYDSYLKIGSVRTPDSISKNSFFFVKYYCAVILGWVTVSENTLNTFYYLVEEELRRSDQKMFQNYTDYDKFNIINKEEFTSEEQVEHFVEKHFYTYAQMYQEKCKNLRIIFNLILNYPDGKVDFKNVKLNEDKDAILSDLKIDKLGVYAMFFQNQIHYDSSVRKKAFNDNFYFDCRNNPRKVFEIFSTNVNEIREKRQKQIEQIHSTTIDVENLRPRFKNVDVINILKEFRICEDIGEAENLLDKAMKIKPGRGVHYYFNIFYGANEIPLLYEKLKLLKNNHKNFANAIKSKHNYDFCYLNLLTNEELVEIFGLKKIPRHHRNLYKSKHNL